MGKRTKRKRKRTKKPNNQNKLFMVLFIFFFTCIFYYFDVPIYIIKFTSENNFKNILVIKREPYQFDYALISNNQEIMVDDCDSSGKRQANVKVDIGVDSNGITREYYAYTNEYGQLVYVEADEIIIQNDDIENVNSDGRYCSKMADVDGVGEKYDMDRGHAIADSLGGSSNAYNITPQDSFTNRQGEQSDFEEQIRTAEQNGKRVTNFHYIITYPTTRTQTPEKYQVEFEINGVYYQYEFLNE